jgi:hypothetical protein
MSEHPNYEAKLTPAMARVVREFAHALHEIRVLETQRLRHVVWELELYRDTIRELNAEMRAKAVELRD